MTLFGDYTWNILHLNTKEQEQPEAKHSKTLFFVLLLAYVGAGTFMWTFEHMCCIKLALLLSTQACITLLTIANVLILCTPTIMAGYILQHHFIEYKINWAVHLVHSFIEVGVCLGVTYGSHALYQSMVVAVQLGTVSGMLVTLTGEGIQRMYQRLVSPKLQDENNNKKLVPIPIMVVLVPIFGAMAFDLIFTYLRSI